MQPLNAIDAITPAFTRTHETLFQPFRFGRTWKLCASQYLGFCGSMFLPIPLFLFLIPQSALPPGFRGVMLAFSLIPTFVLLVILYFCGRMELVSSEMIVTRQKFIGPMWSRYAGRIWPWLLLKIAVGIAITVIAGAIFAVPLRHGFEQFAALAASMPQGPNPDTQAFNVMINNFTRQIFTFQLIFYGFFFLLKVPSTLLHDFVMPFYILEEITLSEALRRGAAIFVADPVQVLLYLVLKPILFTIGYVIQYVSMLVLIIPLIIVGVIVAFAGAAVFSHNTTALVFGGVLLYIVFIGFLFWVMIGTLGYLLTLLNAYGLYFLGGRYRHLGEMLEPTPGAPFTPPPVFPSPEEQSDDSNDPPMPMDPAVA